MEDDSPLPPIVLFIEEKPKTQELSHQNHTSLCAEKKAEFQQHLEPDNVALSVANDVEAPTPLDPDPEPMVDGEIDVAKLIELIDEVSSTASVEEHVADTPSCESCDMPNYAAPTAAQKPLSVRDSGTFHKR